MAANSGFDTLEKRLKYLKENKIPTLYLITERDNILEKKYFFDAINIINDHKNNSYNYDIFDGNKTDVKLVSNYENDANILQVVNIRPAGHFAFIKFSNIFNPYVEKLINSTQS